MLIERRNSLTLPGTLRGSLNVVGDFVFDNERNIVAVLNPEILTNSERFRFGVERSARGIPQNLVINGFRYSLIDMTRAIDESWQRDVWDDAEVGIIEQILYLILEERWYFNLNWSFDLCWDGATDERFHGNIARFWLGLNTIGEEVDPDLIDLTGSSVSTFTIDTDIDIVDWGLFDWERLDW